MVGTARAADPGSWAQADSPPASAKALPDAVAVLRKSRRLPSLDRSIPVPSIVTTFPQNRDSPRLGRGRRECTIILTVEKRVVNNVLTMVASLWRQRRQLDRNGQRREVLSRRRRCLARGSPRHRDDIGEDRQRL